MYPASSAQGGRYPPGARGQGRHALGRSPGTDILPCAWRITFSKLHHLELGSWDARDVILIDPARMRALDGSEDARVVVRKAGRADPQGPLAVGR